MPREHLEDGNSELTAGRDSGRSGEELPGGAVVSDYGKGVCTPGLLAAARAAAASRGVPVLIDPACIPDYGRFRETDLVKAHNGSWGDASACASRTLRDGREEGEEAKGPRTVPERCGARPPAAP
jgi:hypothetical protein